MEDHILAGVGGALVIASFQQERFYLQEASRYLRHADIHITSAFYADKKKTITPKAFAGLLGNPAAVADGGFTGSGECPPKKRKTKNDRK